MADEGNPVNPQRAIVADKRQLSKKQQPPPDDEEPPRPSCPVCGGRLVKIHEKLCCVQCHSIVETCCD